MKESELSSNIKGDVLYKLFKSVVNELKNAFPKLWKSVSEVSHLIPEPRDFAELTILPADLIKARLKETLKEIKNVTNNNTFLNG